VLLSAFWNASVIFESVKLDMLRCLTLVTHIDGGIRWACPSPLV